MNKKIFLIFSLILLAVAIFGVTKYFKNPPKVGTQDVNENISYGELDASSSKPIIEDKPTSPIIKETAWNIFQKYLSYNKDANLNSVKSVVYKVAEVCNTVEPTQECKDRMASAYSYGSVFDKNKFTNIWSDEKQIIISTDFWTEEIKELKQYGRFRSIIFFVKDNDGNWKMLSFSPFQGKVMDGNNLNPEELKEKAILYTKDNDKDGIADYDEECSDRPEDSKCIKTDSTKRDSDGDGFWDGVDLLLAK
jgi:hypothetical protein